MIGRESKILSLPNACSKSFDAFGADILLLSNSFT